jgi:phage terminase small subunit
MSEILPPDDAEDCGPAMRALNRKQRAFVRAYIDYPLVTATQAARMAGYSDAAGGAKVTAHRALHSPRVIAAINEELDKRFRIDAVIGRKVLMEIAQDRNHPQRLRAAEALLDRGEFHIMSEQRIRVEHTDLNGEAMIERIRQLALRLDVDPARLLGASDPKLIELDDVNDPDQKAKLN